MSHPDFFADGSPAVKAQAEHNSALLNEAHDILSDDVRRADWLVRHLGGPDEIEERQMPQAFLMEVLDWNETLDEARKTASEANDAAFDASPAASAATPAASAATIGAKLSELEQTLNANRASEVTALRAQLAPLPARGSPALRDARKRLNAIRYVDRALSELEALRLSRPSAR